jgi:hypothetical protein
LKRVLFSTILKGSGGRVPLITDPMPTLNSNTSWPASLVLQKQSVYLSCD